MTNLEALEMSMDGPLPPAAVRAAQAKDRAAPAAPRIARTLLRLKAYKPAGTIEAMARALVRTRRLRGDATRMDLQRQGFRVEEIERFGDRAVARAAALWPADDAW
ncbi:MAG: hypothetical protein Kow00114_27350 [Kiloniellaceae bacterium]